MSNYSNPKRKSGSSPFGRTNSSSQRPASSSSGRGNRPRPQSNRASKSFDPSLFMKKVEEQMASETYVPKHSFTDFLLEEQVKKNIIARGYKNPTPIQDQAIPVLLKGQDVIATANTGTGKTAAFLIPLVNNVVTKKVNKVLIITPTRELAGQIQDELKLFSIKTGITSALCIGGVNINNQIRECKKSPTFVIGTPGRLLDLENNKVIRFNHYNAIVLDEVDTMLDMGFLKDIKYIISQLPNQRHSLFFSATIPQNMQDIITSFLHNPVSISVKTRQTAENVNQDVVKIGTGNKLELLHEILIKPDVKKTIIFLRTKHAADKLAKILAARGFNVAAIHGNKTQAQRNKALSLFKDNRVNILIATDVVARGIDIDDVSHVINYDLPATHEDYVHRIGRTGRASKIGQAITFIE